LSLGGLGGKFRLPIGVVPQVDQQPLNGVVLQFIGTCDDRIAGSRDRDMI
jgi:hypothetical protein